MEEGAEQTVNGPAFPVPGAANRGLLMSEPLPGAGITPGLGTTTAAAESLAHVESTLTNGNLGVKATSAAVEITGAFNVQPRLARGLAEAPPADPAVGEAEPR